MSLILHYTFDNLLLYEDYPIFDNSGNGNHSVITKINNLTRENYNENGKNSRIGSGCIYLNGINNYITTPTSVKLPGPMSYSIWAYMDDWVNYAAKDMRLLSCTLTGGWNIETNSINENGEIRIAVYDSSSKSYKNIAFNKEDNVVKWKDLSSGWHMFTFTFNGSTATFYIDDCQYKESSTGFGGSIGYNPNNTIFIGAEAGNDLITPNDKNYFLGKIDDFKIYDHVLSENDIKNLYRCRGKIYDNKKFYVNEIQEFDAINNEMSLNYQGILKVNEINEVDAQGSFYKDSTTGKIIASFDEFIEE